MNKDILIDKVLTNYEELTNLKIDWFFASKDFKKKKLIPFKYNDLTYHIHSDYIPVIKEIINSIKGDTNENNQSN